MIDPKEIAKAIVTDDEPEATSEGDELAVSGSNVMDAMKRGDPEAFTSALKEFVGMCGGSSYSESE